MSNRCQLAHMTPCHIIKQPSYSVNHSRRVYLFLIFAMNEQELLQNFITELRRGSLTLAILASLKMPHYGYALLEILQAKHIDIEANTLYPLLRRLESQGLLTSSWDTSESRPRKYYVINDYGRTIYAALLKEWKEIQSTISQFEKEDEL